MATTAVALAEYRDRRAAVIAWLRGERRTLPAYDAEPAPETKAIARELIALNQYGILTDQSQPGLRLKLVQRAFIAGFIPWPLWEQIEEVVAEMNFVVAFVQRADVVGARQVAGIAPSIPVTLDHGTPFTFVGFPEPYRPRTHVEPLQLVTFQAFDPRWGIPKSLFTSLLGVLRDAGVEKDLR